MVAMVLLVLRYICDFYFKAQVEFGSCPVPVFQFLWCEPVCRYHCSLAIKSVMSLFWFAHCFVNYGKNESN